jgi:hypothetical protein
VIEVSRLRTQRDRVLIATYRLTGGDRDETVMPSDVQEATDLDAYDAQQAVRWLIDHDMLETMSLAGDVALTPDGVDRAEALLSDERESAAAATLSYEERRVLERFVRDVRIVLESASLDVDDGADAEAQLATIEAQARSPRPRRDVIGGAILGLKLAAGAALSGVIGNAAYAGLLALAPG